MALPKFRSMRHRRQEGTADVPATVALPPADVEREGEIPISAIRSSSDRTLGETGYTPGVDIKRATRTRRNAVIASSVFFFISVIFLILVEIGGTYNKPVLRSTYFFSVNLSNIIPTSIPNAELINSITRTIGLHDFYNPALWGFCEGYDNEGVTYCSPPQTLYYFNPVEILLNELLAGATIALPSEINNILNLIKVISHLMFGFFLTAACVNFVAVFLSPLVLYSRWWSLPIVIFTFIGALLTVAGSVIGTVYAIVVQNALTSQPDLNIGVSLGVNMFAFMWTAVACVLVAWIIQLCLSCCCASRRDIKKGKKKGSEKAYGDVPVKEAREGRRFKLFGRSAKRVN